MSETLAYIDDYFSGALPAPERAAFESRIAADPAFAAEVAYYVTSRDVVKQERQARKKEAFMAMYRELPAGNRRPKGIRIPLPVIGIAAAACLLLFLGWQFLFRPESPRQLADRYVQANLQTLSVTMGDGRDSLQLGIAAYNRRDYAAAAVIFGELAGRDASNAEAVQHLGLVYLVTERYEEAVGYFDALSRLPGLHANPGLFYKAVTLMKRSGPGDREAARELLEKVVRQKLPGSVQASAWLEDL